MTDTTPRGSLLSVASLGVVTAGERRRPIVANIDFTLAPGSSVGLVGRSGAGKSSIGNALLGLLPRGLELTPESRITLGADDLRAMDAAALRHVRGRRLAMVFQEPLSALDPAMRIGAQLSAVLRAHGVADRREAAERAIAMLSRVGIGDARVAVHRYPHEFSGGMRQRLLLAMALLLEPEVLIADEPTTSLDVTLQAQLLDLLDALRANMGTTLLLISHDLNVVAERCDRVLLLEDGALTADGPAAAIIEQHRRASAARTGTPLRVPAVPAPSTPSTPSTSPAPSHAASLPHAAPLADLRDVSVHFLSRRRLRDRITGVVRAVDGVTLQVARGECLGLVGESGCGKTTLARAVMGLEPTTGGSVHLAGTPLATLRGESLRRLRRTVQMIPQEAGASLTPERTVLELVREGLEVHDLARGADADGRARAAIEEVGLDASFATRRPGSLSTGERQRVAIARAIAIGPQLLICDEPVSSVDAETRERILALLDRLRREHGMAMLFISHDLSAVQRLASRLAVMYLGRVVERSDASDALTDPWMPYSQALRAAIPTGESARTRPKVLVRGEFPSPLHPPSGCTFHPRCTHPARDATCQVSRPELAEVAPGRWVACPKVVPYARPSSPSPISPRTLNPPL
jgi:peptide/nickel transport system ATP-binding protein